MNSSAICGRTDLPQDLPLLEDDPAAAAAGQADVGLLGFSRPVDGAAHDGHRQRRAADPRTAFSTRAATPIRSTSQRPHVGQDTKVAPLARRPSA